MATKQATTEQNEIDFDSMSLEEIEALEKAEQENKRRFNKQNCEDSSQQARGFRFSHSSS